LTNTWTNIGWIKLGFCNIFAYMKTTLDSSRKVYQVVKSNGDQAFCNIDKLNKVVKDMRTRQGYFTIYMFWNNKPKRVTKTDLKKFFEGSHLKQEFDY